MNTDSLVKMCIERNHFFVFDCKCFNFNISCWFIVVIYLKLIVTEQIIEYPNDQNRYKFAYTKMTFEHAESPAWDPEGGVLYWVDVLNQNVHALHYYTQKHSAKHIAYGQVNLVVPVANSSRLLVGVRSEAFLLDWRKKGNSALRLVTALDLGSPDNVLNEGKADARGRLWAGTKGPHIGDEVKPNRGALYVVQWPRAPEFRLKPVTISNGMAWSINNSVMYYTDSATKRIDAFDFNLDAGTISRRRTVIDLQELYPAALPDGMTIDRDGMLWVALMFDGSVLRIDPDIGQILEVIELPVSRTTSVTWAGPQLRDLVVTTSRRNMAAEQLEKEPLAGSIFFIYDLNTSGVPPDKVVFENADEY